MMRVLVAIGLTIALALLVLRLAAAPLNAAYDAHDCRQAYARARTLADSVRVDLHPYAIVGSTGRRTCGEVRARLVSNFAR